MHSIQCVTIISKCNNSCRKKHCLIKIEFYVWQERDFESTCLTDDSWANVVFRPGPSSLWQQKQETGFPFWILFQTKTITKYHFCNMMVMVGVTPWTLPSASQGIDTMQESRSTLCACDVSSNPRSNCLFKGRRVV